MALGLFFSTRFNRSFMALGASLGTMFVWLLVTPIVLSVMERELGRWMVESVYCFNPYASQAMVTDLMRNGSFLRGAAHPSELAILLSCPIANIVGTIVLVALSSLGISRQDRDIAIARGRKDA